MKLANTFLGNKARTSLTYHVIITGQVLFSTYVNLSLFPFRCMVLKCLPEHVIHLIQNGCQFSILLLVCNLALVASFKGKYSFEFRV